jgi:hypothetical protein
MSLLSHLLLPADGDPPTCNLTWICRQLGHDGGEASQIRYAEALIALHGFPHPLPHLAHGGTVSRSIHPTRSQWLRTGVEAWLADYLPPAGAAAIDAAAARDAAADMDNAALNLRLVGGTEA